MSETIVQTVDSNAMVDIFGDSSALGNNPAPSFGRNTEPTQADLFNTTPSTTEQTTEAPVSTTTETTVDTSKEADILGTSTAEPVITGSPITDLAKYYEERMNSGFFSKITVEDEKGNEVLFVPKTAEEYDEVLELQISDRVAKATKEMESKWYESKSPAWKAISQYAELVDDPTQLIPFLQGVRTYQSVASLNEDEADGAEQIVRTRLAQRGDPEEVISQQIESLKTTDTLIKTAKAYKPIILQQEQQQLLALKKEEEDRDRQYRAVIDDIRQNAYKEIEQPIFGKTKLKQEEKAAIYDLIGEPVEETQGFGIYTAIDQLFDKKDFKTLKEIALLLANKDSFYNYLGINVANQTAASLEKKLRLAGEGRTNSGKDVDMENKTTISRNQFKSKPTFGRSENIKQ